VQILALAVKVLVCAGQNMRSDSNQAMMLSPVDCVAELPKQLAEAAPDVALVEVLARRTEARGIEYAAGYLGHIAVFCTIERASR
jgi:hypothetical protein